MTIYIHIGTEKTGTTALQEFLSNNRKYLSKHSITYPNYMGDTKHIALWPLMLNVELEKDKIIKWIPDEWRYERGVIVQKCIYALKREHASSFDHIIFSNEHIFSYSTEVYRVENLLSFLREFDDDIKVIVYLRPQCELIPSLYSSRVRSGINVEIDELIEKTQWLFYDRVLSNFSLYIEKENIIIRKYTTEIDIITDFLSILGLSEIPLGEKKHEVNKSLDSIQLEILSRINRILPPFVEGARNSLRSELVKFIQKKPLGPPYTLTPDQRSCIEKKFRESNRRLEKEFLDGETFRSEKEYCDLAFQPDCDEMIVKMLVDLWREYVETRKKYEELRSYSMLKAIKMKIKKIYR